VASYGIANQSGQPGADEVGRILGAARRHGVRILDTARGYGSAESVIGEAADATWRVVTKLDPEVVTESAEESVNRARASIEASTKALGRDTLDTLLLHRAAHRTAHGGAVWAFLRAQRDAGVIGKLGVSANTPEEALDALDDPDVATFQVASNLLDQRLLRRGFFDEARKCGREVFVRSVFLQGVAFLKEMPPTLKGLEKVLADIDQTANALGLSRPELFLLFAATAFDATLVLGCERAEQIETTLGWLSSHDLTSDEVASLRRVNPALDERLLTPSRWAES
jgi:spore coat polysaccharide biosynthesis protein SpsF